IDDRLCATHERSCSIDDSFCARDDWGISDPPARTLQAVDSPMRIESGGFEIDDSLCSRPQSLCARRSRPCPHSKSLRRRPRWRGSRHESWAAHPEALRAGLRARTDRDARALEGSLTAKMSALETSIIKWLVGSVISSAALAFAFAKLVS